jgi:uncharacterized protein YecT (DUF1311 family)
MKFPIPFFISTFALVFGFVVPELKGAEISSKQSEALFQELVRFPQFKTADEEMSAAYKKARSGMSEKGQTALREEQRKWLNERDQAILSSPPGQRLEVAVSFTRGRAARLLGVKGEVARAKGAEISSKQSEALFQELVRFPQFKTADEEMSAAYKKARSGMSEKGQTALRDEQRGWLNERDQAVLSSPPGQRLEVAVSFTRGRVARLLGVKEAPPLASDTTSPS